MGNKEKLKELIADESISLKAAEDFRYGKRRTEGHDRCRKIRI